MKALAIFFAFGALMAGLVAIALTTPGGPLEPIWALKPGLREAFVRVGPGVSAAGMALVSVACGAASIGLWRGRTWGIRLASTILIVNLLGDVLNATVGHDPRAWIGVPVALALLVYLAHRGRQVVGRGRRRRGD